MPKNRKKKISKKKTKKRVKILRSRELDGLIFDSSSGKTDSLFVNNSAGIAVFASQPVKKELDELIKEFDQIQQRAENAQKTKAEAGNFNQAPKAPQALDNKNNFSLKRFFNISNRFF